MFFQGGGGISANQHHHQNIVNNNNINNNGGGGGSSQSPLGISQVGNLELKKNKLFAWTIFTKQGQIWLKYYIF